MNIFDTHEGNHEPTISWDSNNWYIQGPYQYFTPPKSNDQTGLHQSVNIVDSNAGRFIMDVYNNWSILKHMILIKYTK